MRFETQTLLRLAYRSGIQLTRTGRLIHIVHSFGRGNLPPAWVETVKRHKPELLKALPDREQDRQIDLFYDDF